MNQVVPSPFLFRWAFQAKRVESVPSPSGRLLNLPSDCQLPSISELTHQKPFATVSLAWNDKGLAVSLAVAGRSSRPECQLNDLGLSDGIRLWINTRNNQTIHRATRFCHHFVVLPAGGGTKKLNPIVRSLPVARAREEVALPPTDSVKTQSECNDSGYWLEMWFPAEVFVGFDPETNPKLGFHYLVKDSQLGNQTLAVGNEFPYDSDPSLWQTVDLVS